MTLGGRLKSPQMEKGLEDLWRLWNLLFGAGKQISPSTELPHREHRTAGILYNFEIRQGQALPVPKIYIPVRHYGRDDSSIADGLRTFLRQDLAVDSYVEALESIL